MQLAADWRLQRVQEGELRSATICVEAGARLGVASVVMGGARVGKQAELGDAALLPASCALAARDERFGSDITAEGEREEEDESAAVLLLPLRV